jgi:hypothetical protein
VEEKVSFDVLQVKGHCRVELRNAKTDELVDVREGDNFLSYGLLNAILKQMQKAVFAGFCPRAGLGLPPLADSSFNYSYNGAFRYLILTDSNMVENSSTESEVPGNVVGWCDRSAYAGTDVLRGTLNYNESFADEKEVRWVFDFGTDKANGTINSVCWAYTQPGQETSLGSSQKTCMSNINFIAKLPRNYFRITYGDGYFWGVSNGILYKIDPLTYEEVATYSHSTVSDYFAIHGGYMYTTSGGSYIRKLNLSDMTYTQKSISSINYHSVWGIDGTHVYTHRPGYASSSYKIKISDLTLDGSITLPIFQVTGIFSVNNALYTICELGIYEWDPVGAVFNKVSDVGFYDLNNYVYVFSDGTNIYMSYREQYKTIANGVVGLTSELNQTNLASIPSVTGLKRYNLMARKLLDTPIVKTSSHVMKVVYEFTFG